MLLPMARTAVSSGRRAARPGGGRATRDPAMRRVEQSGRRGFLETSGAGERRLEELCGILVGCSPMKHLLAGSILVASVMVAGADEGMWLFNQPPREVLLARYQFDATDAWLGPFAEVFRAVQLRRLGQFCEPGRLADFQPPCRRGRLAETQHPGEELSPRRLLRPDSRRRNEVPRP